ncbi:MAG: hypothetical protein AAFY71_03385 [Bacteroidota bacterium]
MTGIKAYDEIVDLLAGGGSPERVLSFRPSKETQARLNDLLNKKKSGELNEEELEELSHFKSVEHILRMMKVRVREKMAG